MKIIHSALGKNQQYVYAILSDLSQGRIVQDIRYYGGSVYNGQRCISIGRECSLHYGIPWWIIDVRHAGALFKQAHGDRLGYSCLRTFNRAFHDLIRNGYAMPLPTKIIAQGRYDVLLRHTLDSHNPDACEENLRFIMMHIPDALSTD